jgi:hypothetical protein
MNYWQVAAGDGNRDYPEIFLKYGIMLIGNGTKGNYFENKDYYQQWSDIPSFAEDVEDGNIVVLKRPSGTSWEVLAVGKVKEKYDYLPAFEDVEGWSLQHCRYVEWYKPKEKKVIQGLRRGTFSGINKQTTIESINRILNDSILIRPQPIPKSVKRLEDEELIDTLISHGLRPADAEEFTHTIQRIRRLVKWYDSEGEDVKEHETRTFLIIPLLLALGWPEQKLKIEWNNIDIAFFDKPYNEKNSSSNDCIIILESKRLGDGLSYATSQGTDYAKIYSKCNRVIISDGCRYRLYKRKDNTWIYSAYLNILKPKVAHPYEKEIRGAPDVFLNLMAR